MTVAVQKIGLFVVHQLAAVTHYTVRLMLHLVMAISVAVRLASTARKDGVSLGSLNPYGEYSQGGHWCGGQCCRGFGVAATTARHDPGFVCVSGKRVGGS